MEQGLGDEQAENKTLGRVRKLLLAWWAWQSECSLFPHNSREKWVLTSFFIHQAVLGYSPSTADMFR